MNPAEQSVSLATLGQVDEQALQERLTEILREFDESWLANMPAMHSAAMSLSRKGDEVLLQKATCYTAPKFWKWREFEWPEEHDLEAHSGEEWKSLAVQAAVCGVALIAGYAAGHWWQAPGWLSVSFYLVSLVAGAWDAAKDAWEKVREGVLDIHFLMLAVAAGAVSIGAWEEGALLLFLFSLSGALEHYVLHRTHREISALTKAAPKLAHVVQADGSTVDRPVSELDAGDVLLVRPDELFAVDAVVVEGQTAADESNLTGEALPVEKGMGAEVSSGTLNLWGVVRVKVLRPARQSALHKIITLIQHAQQSRAPSQRFTDHFGTRYTAFVLAVVVTMFFIWWLALGLPPFTSTPEVRSAFYRSMTLLVVMSPCALVLSIPSAILAAIAWGARRGILFRGGAAIERLAEVDTVAMDKTGTLTKGELKVARVESFPAGQETTVLRAAVALEAGSNHPIARAIVQHGQEQGVEPVAVTEFQSIAGQGLRGRTEQGVSYLGRRELIAKSALVSFLDQIPDAPLGFSEVWVLQEGVLGRILLKDEIRQGSKPVLQALAKHRVRTLMLTGDRRAAATEVAKELGLSEVRAGLHPEDKVNIVKELTAAGHRVAMIGDGVNDAPSLAVAHVSIAMGARGSDAALEQADIVLMQDRIEKLLSALTISTSAKRIIKQNIAISLGAVVIMGVAALVGQIPLTLGVLAHEGSTVVVCLNSLRLLFVKESGQGDSSLGA